MLSERIEIGPKIIMFNKNDDILFHFYKDMNNMCTSLTLYYIYTCVYALI